ncbi:FecR family protein [Siphonobacter sp. BAB-5385]|uniref:FecR family protein n=1 Tax=Siphonobacter sp. BAB-5385 TaxID=1864822 RepID=UPI00113FF763|nr:FecR domain-containing protein [Siphonobacter sp. BAB-5385]
MKPLLPVELLEKYTAGKASPEEREQVEQWYKSFEPDKDLPESWSAPEREEIKKELYSKITEQVGLPRERSPFDWKRAIAIASGIILVLSLGFYVWKQEATGPQQLVYENPTKELKRLTLPDQSQLCLYPGARVSLAKDFGDDTRSLTLTGIAFFQVQRDERRPFIIHSKGLVTQVLGTSFLIDANPASRRVEVSVLTGKVRVKEEQSKNYIVLLPKQKAYYQNGEETKVYETSERDPSKVWERGDFVFVDTPLTAITEALTQRFGVVFEVEDEKIYQCQLSAHFTNQNLPDILEMISKSLNISYELNQNRVIIKGQGCSL